MTNHTAEKEVAVARSPFSPKILKKLELRQKEMASGKGVEVTDLNELRSSNTARSKDR